MVVCVCELDEWMVDSETSSSFLYVQTKSPRVALESLIPSGHVIWKKHVVSSIVSIRTGYRKNAGYRYYRVEDRRRPSGTRRSWTCPNDSWSWAWWALRDSSFSDLPNWSRRTICNDIHSVIFKCLAFKYSHLVCNALIKWRCYSNWNIHEIKSVIDKLRGHGTRILCGNFRFLLITNPQFWVVCEFCVF